MQEIIEELISKKEIKKYLKNYYGIKSEDDLLKKIKLYNEKQIIDFIFELIDIEVAFEYESKLNFKHIKKTGHVIFSSDGLNLFHITETNVNIYNYPNLEIVTTLNHIKDPRNLVISQNNKYFVISGDYTGKIALYNYHDYEHVITFSIFKGDNNHLSNSMITPDEEKIIVGDNAGIYSFDIKTQLLSKIKSFDYEFSRINKIEYIPKIKQYMFNCYRRIDNYHSHNFIIRWNYPFNDNQPVEVISQLHFWKVTYNSKFKQFVFSENGDLIFTDELFNTITGNLRLSKNKLFNLQYHWSPDGNYLILSYDNNVKIYKYPDLNIAVNLKITSVSNAYFSGDSEYIIIESINGTFIKEFNQMCNVVEEEQDDELSKEMYLDSSVEINEENCIEVIGKILNEYEYENSNSKIPSSIATFLYIYHFTFLVNEGNLYQYFFDASPFEIIEIKKALMNINSKEILILIKRAIRLYEEERGVSLNHDLRYLIELNKNLVRLHEWDKLSEEYYLVNESLDKLCFNYYKDNIYDFKKYLFPIVVNLL